MKRKDERTERRRKKEAREQEGEHPGSKRGRRTPKPVCFEVRVELQAALTIDRIWIPERR